MAYVEVNGCELIRGRADAAGPVIYVIDAPEHPFELQSCCANLHAHAVRVPVRSWNESLTPWVAPGLYKEEPPFGGHARATLDELVREVIPAVEMNEGLEPRARALCGYSLGGLFALYGLTHTDAFVACACLSGSVWYEGWVEYLRSLDVRLGGRFAFLSVGTKEKRAARPQLKGVQRNMEECARALEMKGCAVRYVTGPGNHFQHVEERFAAGLLALEEFFYHRG